MNWFAIIVVCIFVAFMLYKYFSSSTPDAATAVAVAANPAVAQQAATTAVAAKDYACANDILTALDGIKYKSGDTEATLKNIGTQFELHGFNTKTKTANAIYALRPGDKSLFKHNTNPESVAGQLVFFSNTKPDAQNYGGKVYTYNPGNKTITTSDGVLPVLVPSKCYA